MQQQRFLGWKLLLQGFQISHAYRPDWSRVSTPVSSLANDMGASRLQRGWLRASEFGSDLYIQGLVYFELGWLSWYLLSRIICAATGQLYLSQPGPLGPGLDGSHCCCWSPGTVGPCRPVPVPMEGPGLALAVLRLSLLQLRAQGEQEQEEAVCDGGAALGTVLGSPGAVPAAASPSCPVPQLVPPLGRWALCFLFSLGIP